jgi:hypothetical protein
LPKLYKPGLKFRNDEFYFELVAAFHRCVNDTSWTIAAMIECRPFNPLGGEDHDWRLAEGQAPFLVRRLREATEWGWGSLRVWNDDEIAPNRGFPPTPTQTWKSSSTSAKAR